MLAVNDVGKPCAGEPHARIDGRELETEHTTDHGDGEEQPNGKPTGHTAPAPTAGRSHRASSRPSSKPVDQVVRPCSWCNRTSAAAVMVPIRHGHRLTRRSALKVVLSSEFPRSASARVAE